MRLVSPAVMEYQVQINSIKAKLQETRARKKQQEELIMKVENQALKVRGHTCQLLSSPWMFMSHWNPPWFFLPLSPLQNRFQALLDEIIQQEEREMEQVKPPSAQQRDGGGVC